MKHAAPRKIKIEIFHRTGKYKKEFFINYLSFRACMVLEKLFENIEKLVIDAEVAEKTNYCYVEENRALFSLIAATGVYNVIHLGFNGAEYSIKTYRFIKQNATAKDLLILFYLIKKHYAAYALLYYMDVVNEQKIEELSKVDLDKVSVMLKDFLRKSEKQYKTSLAVAINKLKKENDQIIKQLAGSKNDFPNLIINNK